METEDYVYETEDYPYESEPELRLNRRQIQWLAGGAVAAALAACVCVLCLIAAFYAGYSMGGQTPAEPTPDTGQVPEPVMVHPVEAKVGEAVSFDGSGSRPGSSPISTYDWDFGDGNGTRGTVVTHVYNTPGNYQVTLTVAGEDGLANTSAPGGIAITEAAEPAPTPGQPPQPVMTSPPQAEVAQEVTFDGSQSQPGSSPIAAYDWDFGDGNRGNGPVVTHGYSAAGTYQVTLTVTGQDGLANTGGPVQILIVEAEPTEPPPPVGQPPEPVASFPPDAKVGEPVTFDASQSRPGSSPISAYEWDFGDGNIGNGPIATHAYGAAGVFMVTLTVNGQDGFANTGEPAPITITE